MKILLIEDNLLNQKVVLFNLRKLNYDITAIVNGREALEELKINRYDLILMDIMLPEMNGLEISRQYRIFEKEAGFENEVPIIALTANTYDNDRDKCISAGMNEYLAKPFTAQQLIDVMSKFI